LARIFFLRLCFAIFFFRRFRKLGITSLLSNILLYAVSESASRFKQPHNLLFPSLWTLGGREKIRFADDWKAFCLEVFTDVFLLYAPIDVTRLLF